MFTREPVLRQGGFLTFRQTGEPELTDHGTEPHEIIYFKLYKNQIPVSEQAIETAALMPGSEVRGYCLELIYADFLAGANLDDGNPEISLDSSPACLQPAPSVR